MNINIIYVCCLSRMMRKYHVRFLEGKAPAMGLTYSTLLIASIQTFVFDILYPSHSLKTIEDTNDPEKMKGLLRYGRKMVYLFGLISPLFIYLVSIVIPGVLDLFFLVYSAQIILLIPICVAIFRKDCVRMRKYAIFSLSAGFLASVYMMVWMLFHPVEYVYLSAPLVSILVSAIPWFFIKKGEGYDTGVNKR